MFDLTFHTSVLDKMPVGTSFRDSDHEIVKTDGGWTCDECPSAPLHGSSSAYISSPSRERALSKFAGAVIDPDDLDPRLMAFLPAGTKVADRDTENYKDCHWHKTKSGRWIWANSSEEAEDISSDGTGFEDMSGQEYLRPFRLVSDEVTVGEQFEADEATKLVDYALKDCDGDLWRFNKEQEFWGMTWADGSTSEIRRGSLSSEHEPYTVYEKAETEPEKVETPADPLRLTAAEATSVRDIVYDNGGGKWIYTSEGGYRLVLGGGLLGTLREQLPADYAPYFTEDPRAESAPEPEPEPEPETETEPETEEIPEGKTVFSAAEATNFKDCRFRDRDDDVWLFDEETERWRFILSDGSLSSFLQYERLSPSLEPLFLVEGEVKVEAEPETEVDPAEKTKFTAEEASEHKDTVFEDRDGDTWFFDYGMQRWRAIGPDWSYAKEELWSFHGPYTKVGPLHEFERHWTAEEANDFKDEALEDSDGDIWIYDVPSEQWKCSSAAIANSELDAYFQPYRIKKAAQASAAPGSAIFLGYDEPFQLSGDTEESSSEAGSTGEVTFEGSAKEAVELLDRIARALESIDRKLGDK